MLRPAVRLYRGVLNKSCEDKFNTELMKSVRVGDVVWDIGANVGFYTRKFADAVGPRGLVVAFEPSPASAARVRGEFSEIKQVKVEDVALSDNEGTMDFFVSENSVTDSLFKREGVAPAQVKVVTVKRGDSFAHLGEPDVIKVDVEGFEPEVVSGLAEILRTRKLRSIFIEVHFVELRRRRMPNAANEIVERLRSNGLTPRWIDPSHLVASRT